jgi:hypothetical protein
VFEAKLMLPWSRKRDADLFRALAETLRSESEKAKTLRSTLVQSLVHPEIKTAFDVFGSDLPDEVFAGVFEQFRQKLCGASLICEIPA